MKLKFENREQPSSHIEVQALETDRISVASLPTLDKYIRKTHNKLKGLQLADSYEYTSKQIAVLIGTVNYYTIVIDRIKRLKKNLVATETLFSANVYWVVSGQKLNCST